MEQSSADPTDRPRRLTRWLQARFGDRATLVAELLVALVVIGVLVLAFAGLADEFPERAWLGRLDDGVALWLHARHTPLGVRLFVAVSWLGSPVLFAVDLLASLALALRRQWTRLVLWVSAVVGAAVLDRVLKAAFHRDRPIYASEFIRRASWSFPSGHAMNSLVVYSVLAFLLLEHVREPARRRALVAATALLVLAIGFSRIYLGVHFVSDVAAGYLAGGAWVVACLATFRMVQRG
jgi:membrane-associated phospholipid phosphatase